MLVEVKKTMFMPVLDMLEVEESVGIVMPGIVGSIVCVGKREGLGGHQGLLFLLWLKSLGRDEV